MGGFGGWTDARRYEAIIVPMLKKIGPYRVEERLGVGGMGEVYKAFDDRLDRWVAVKRIRPDKEEAEDNRERFLREARATAKLNHPAIVHVYDIFKDGESLCIVMEYVEGRTLDTMVIEGALDPLRVARLGYEIASGLSEAHSKGIIHRDLKVENIIITPEDHAKILDFGLAKPLLSNELDPSLTGKGQLVGTSRAMSPEYVSGEEIDHRSDLFSFGVLLYEAATGHSPFKAHNTLATLKQVMVHEQTRACEINPAVSEELSDLIDRLLSKDPLDRPDSALDVGRSLGEILGSVSSATVPRPASSVTSGTRRPVYPVPSATATTVDALARRRWLQLAGVLIFVVVSSLAVASWARQWLVIVDSGWNAPAAWATSRQEHVVLADFVNQTGEELLDSVGLAFRLDLEQSRQAQILSESQVSEVLKRMERDPKTEVDQKLGLEICRREGARALVSGSIVKIGATYRLTGTIVEPLSGDNILTKIASAGSQTEILPALSEVTQSIRVKLGESLAAIRETPHLEKVTTRDLEALKAYSIGVTRLEEKSWEEARDLLLRALEIDPEFAMAHAKLAGIYIDRLADSEKGLRHLEMALASKDRLTELEELYVEGWMARLREDPAQIIRRWELMTSLFPQEYLGHFNVAKANLLLFNRYEKAAASFARAVELGGSESRSTSLAELAICQLANGQFDDALESLEKSEWPAIEEYFRDYYLVVRNQKEIERILKEVVSRQSDSKIVEWLISYHSDRGELNEALALSGYLRGGKQDGVENERGSSLVLAAASILETMNRREELGTLLTNSLEQIDRLLTLELERSEEDQDIGSINIFLPVPSWALLTKIAVRSNPYLDTGSVSQAMSRLAESEQQPTWLAYARIVEGESLARAGELEAGVAKLRESIGAAEFSHAHESLARLHLRMGQKRQAVNELLWIIEHRSRSYVECYTGCRPLALIDWNLASFYLGKTYFELGEKDKAHDSLQDFVEQWESGTELEAHQKAQEWLAELESPLGHEGP